MLPSFKHFIKEEAANREKIQQLSGVDQKGEDSEDNICMVCMTSFDDMQSEFIEHDGPDKPYCVLRRLSCFHKFHVGCIDKWLVKNTKCPLC